MFRGGGDNAATYQAIQNGNLDISNINADGSTTEEDTIIRLSLDWQMNDDIMIYGVYSEGYRPATQNRNAGQLGTNQSGVYEGYVVPAVAVTDTLENIELGLKSGVDGRSTATKCRCLRTGRSTTFRCRALIPQTSPS